MADILFSQSLSVSVAKNPAVVGSAVTEKDFEINQLSYSSSDMNEDSCGRFNIAASATNVVLGMGTVALGKVLILQPESDIVLRITNGAGTSQNLTFKGGKPSVLHMEFISLQADNPNASVLKGRYSVIGD